MNIPTELRYAKSHEWLKEEDGVCTVGLTDFAQDSLGTSSSSTCPRRGTRSPPGRPLGTWSPSKPSLTSFPPSPAW